MTGFKKLYDTITKEVLKPKLGTNKTVTQISEIVGRCRACTKTNSHDVTWYNDGTIMSRCSGCGFILYMRGIT